MYEIGTGSESAQGCAFFPFDSMSGNEPLFRNGEWLGICMIEGIVIWQSDCWVFRPQSQRRSV